jgi:hypothetical protein
MKMVPAEPTIAELEKKTGDCEEKVAQESAPVASKLHDLAKLYREWEHP